MKKREKGFTLIEVIVTFCLISTISFLLFQIILSLKNLYTSSDYKTVLLIDQGNLTRRINDDFFDLSLQKIDTCSDITSAHKLCLNFTLLDYSFRDENDQPTSVTKKLEVIDSMNDIERKIIYDGYVMSFAKGSTLGEATAQLSYISDDSTKYNTFLTIDVPVTNKLSEGDFGLHITAQFYTEMDEFGQIHATTLAHYNSIIQKGGLTSVTPITLTTFTVNDLIRRVIATEEGKYTKDGLYDVSLESWHSTDKDFPKYVYKGANPNNFVAIGNQCYRIMQITNENGLKLIYDGTYANNKCTTTTTAPKTSTYGTNNNWLTSPIRNTVLTEFVLNKNVSSNSNFFYGSLTAPTTTTEDTYQNLVTQSMTEKGSSAIQQTPSNYYGDHGKSIAMPTVLDYMLASRSETCTSVLSAIDGNCNSSSYLAKSYNYWTMTADGNNTNNIWSIVEGKLTSVSYSTSYSILPVIYLKSSTTFTNSDENNNPKGSITNPYIANS